ncbi:hypothetical protein ACFLT9_08335 [Acidobacteriota bacterium]
MNIFFLIFFAAISLFPLSADEQELSPGKIIDSVTCRADAVQSYALYLPSNYSPDRTWPILYAFDPGARGRIPLERFREAAERFEFIVVASNNSRNGPWEPILKAASAVVRDTFERFSIDRNRIYATGFSGGGQVASIFPRMLNLPIAGVIVCGAGLASEQKPEDMNGLLYCGISGNADFNYREMRALDERMEKEGITHRMIVFDGEHTWPPPEECTRALEWLVVMGMNVGNIPIDKGMIVETFERELNKAGELVASNELGRAASLYQTLVDTFRDSIDTGGAEQGLKALQSSKSYKKFRKEESKAFQQEDGHLGNVGRILAQIRQGTFSSLDKSQIIHDLELKYLTGKAKREADNQGRLMAIRVLEAVWINSRNSAWTYLDQKDPERAILLFDIAMRAGIRRDDDKKYLYYGSACAYSQKENKKKALEYLILAFRHGLQEVELLEEEQALDFIKETPEFKKILQDMKKKDGEVDRARVGNQRYM